VPIAFPNPPLDDSAPPDVPLTDAYRILRSVAPPDVPFPGRLARSAGDTTVLLVASEDVRDWPALAFDGSGHVLAPRDVVRLGRGVCIELDWCPERLDRLLDRRDAAGAGLRAGEAVTLAVSVRRGLAELALTRPRGVDAWPAGEWWMTDAARPVFVLGAGRPADECSQALLERVAGLTEHPATAAAVSGLAARIDAIAADQTVEAGLFSAAEPLPVTTTVLEPARARSLGMPVHDAAADEAVEPRQGLLTGFLGRHVDADLAATVWDAAHSVLRRVRARRPKPWILAGAVAAIVLAGGVLWPGGGTAEAGDDAADPVASESVPLAPSAPPAVSPAPAASGDAAAAPDEGLAGIAARLLDERLACDEDARCLAGVVEDPAVRLPEGPIDRTGAERTLTLLDELGGVAVLRVESAGERSPDGEAAAQLVVIVESGGRWLIRDAYDVADQDR